MNFYTGCSVPKQSEVSGVCRRLLYNKDIYYLYKLLRIIRAVKSTGLGGLHLCPGWGEKRNSGETGMVIEVHIEIDPKEICCGCWNQLFELAEDCVLSWVFSGMAFNLQVLV